MAADIQLEITLHRIRAITLDLDDTLWAIEPVIRRAEERLWAWLSQHYPRIPEMFSPADVAALRETVIEKHWRDKSHDFRFMRKKVLGMLASHAEYDVNLVEPAFQVFDDARNDVELYPDVLPNLELLSEQYALVAVTNGNANLEAIGIRHLFVDVVTATEVGVAKPAARIFNVAIDKSGVAPDEILHVGDHPVTDVDGGRQAGLKTAWINRCGVEWPEHLDEPDLVVTTIDDVRKELEQASR